MSDHFFTENVGGNVGGILRMLVEWVQLSRNKFFVTL
jgi:hypothetical protein